MQYPRSQPTILLRKARKVRCGQTHAMEGCSLGMGGNRKQSNFRTRRFVVRMPACQAGGRGFESLAPAILPRAGIVRSRYDNVEQLFLMLGCDFRSRQLSFSQPSEDHGSHNQHMQRRADHASDYGGCERLHHFAPCAR